MEAAREGKGKKRKVTTWGGKEKVTNTVTWRGASAVVGLKEGEWRKKKVTTG